MQIKATPMPKENKTCTGTCFWRTGLFWHALPRTHAEVVLISKSEWFNSLITAVRPPSLGRAGKKKNVWSWMLFKMQQNHAEAPQGKCNMNGFTVCCIILPL